MNIGKMALYIPHDTSLLINSFALPLSPNPRQILDPLKNQSPCMLWAGIWQGSKLEMQQREHSRKERATHAHLNTFISVQMPELCPIRMPFAHTPIPIHDLIWKEGSQFVNVNWMGLFSPTLWIPIQLNELAFTMLHIQRSIRMSIQNWIEWNVWVLIPLWIGHILAKCKPDARIILAYTSVN